MHITVNRVDLLLNNFYGVPLKHVNDLTTYAAPELAPTYGKLQNLLESKRFVPLHVLISFSSLIYPRPSYL